MVLKREMLIKFFEKMYGRLEDFVARPLYGPPSVKEYGYGSPVYVEFTAEGTRRRFVVQTLRADRFGHDYMSDRAAALLWAYRAYNKLPGHVRAIDVGYISSDGELSSVKDAEEFFLVVEYVEGELYYRDLERLRDGGELRQLDLDRAALLASYIADLHMADPGDVDREIYTRRIRDLVGHGECIMGLIDSYGWAPLQVTSDEWLRRVEHLVVDWRWKLKGRKHRVRIVHGDYHPWNVMFTGERSFIVLDRSRGDWGEPADDVAAMTINYLFFSLQRSGRFEEPFRSLWMEFYETYLDKTGDEELVEVIQPFYAWRGLVIASPIWYPNLPPNVRSSIFRFIENVLKDEVFNYKNVESYLGE